LFSGPEPIFHSEAEFDQYIAKTKAAKPSQKEISNLTEAYYTNDTTRESTGIRVSFVKNIKKSSVELNSKCPLH